jgi:hypothetical protein
LCDPRTIAPAISTSPFYSRATFDIYPPPPTGWNSKVADIYWRVTITMIKVVFATLLSIGAIAAFVVLWAIIHAFVSTA